MLRSTTRSQAFRAGTLIRANQNLIVSSPLCFASSSVSQFRQFRTGQPVFGETKYEEKAYVPDEITPSELVNKLFDLKPCTAEGNKENKKLGEERNQDLEQAKEEWRRIRQKQEISKGDLEEIKEEYEPLEGQSLTYENVITQMKARRSKYLEKGGFPGESDTSPNDVTVDMIKSYWDFNGIRATTDHEKYLGSVSEGDFVETWMGNAGIVLQVPDNIKIFKYAVLNHQGSVDYYGSARQFSVKVPNLVQVKIKKSRHKVYQVDPSLKDFITCIDSDPQLPIITVLPDLRQELCPRIKNFIEESQSIAKHVEIELENMFLELQDSTDPINISLFEAAYSVEQNMKKNETTKLASSTKNYEMLTDHFPPRELGSDRRRVSSVVLYTVYTSINSIFQDKVLFDANDYPTPSTLTLLPVAMENEQGRALAAMRFATEGAMDITAFTVKEDHGGSIREHHSSFKKKYLDVQDGISGKMPRLIRDLLELEADPSLLPFVLGDIPGSETISKLNSSKQHSLKEKFGYSPPKINREVVNLIKRFASRDIASQDIATLSVVSLFLKHLFLFRPIYQKPNVQGTPKKSISSKHFFFDTTDTITQVTEDHALKFLQNIGVLSPLENPFRLQSKLQPIEKGSTRIQLLTEEQHLKDKYHQTAHEKSGSSSHFTISGESSQVNDLPDRVESIRRELPSELSIYCIDSADAHEIDDGISIANTDKRVWNVYIHIADPASALSFDGQGSDMLLKYAYQQTSTAYYPESVIPMFPKWFSNKLGLVQQTEEEKTLGKSSFKRCLTFEIEFDSKAMTFDMQNAKIYPSVSKSVRQITYSEVDKILADPSSTDSKTSEDLKNLYKVANAYSFYRHLHGKAISISVPQPSVKIEKNNHPFSSGDSKLSINLNLPKPSVANELVAELMILCNATTAKYFDQYSIPGIYRSQDMLVQTNNFREKIEEFTGRLTSRFNWSFPPWNAPNPWSVIEKGIGPKFDIGTSLELLSLFKSATLGIGPKRHCGLGLSEYMHATSPLRRFQDVITHWQLETFLLRQAEAGKSSTIKDKDAKKLTRSSHHLKGPNYMLDNSQIDAMCIRIMRTQAMLKKSSRQSTLFWVLKVLSEEGKSQKTGSKTTKCIVTSEYSLGQHRAYSVDYGVFVTMDLLLPGSHPPGGHYEIGQTIDCRIAEIDPIKQTFVVAPL